MGSSETNCITDHVMLQNDSVVSASLVQDKTLGNKGNVFTVETHVDNRHTS